MKRPARHLLLVAATLAAASSAQAAAQDWNTGGPTNDWNVTDTNWDASAAWINGNDATFGGTGEAVTLGAGISAHNLSFGATGYSIAGNTLTLTGATPTLSVTNSSDSATIFSILAGTAGLTKAGAGTLTLSGANTYTGGTFVNAGVLKSDLLARSGNITLGAITVAAGAVYEMSNTDTTTDDARIVNSSLSGTGTVRKTGAGYLDFGFSGSTINSFGGAFDIQAGTLAFNNGVQGSGLASINISGAAAKLDVRTGTVKIDALNGVAGSQVYVSWNIGATLNLGNNNGSGIFNGTLDDGGSALTLIKNGSGTQTLTGANTYTGATIVNGGTLELNYGSATGILSGSSALTLGGGALSLTGAATAAQTLNGVTTVANTGSGILLAANKTLTLGALTSAGANSALNINTAAGDADASTSTLGTSTVVLTGQTAGNVINRGFTVTDSTGFGLATVDASNNIIRRTATTLLPASGATTPTDYQIDNNAGGAAADGSSSLAVTASQSAGSITVDTTAAAGTLSLSSGVILSNNTWNFGGVGSNTYQITGNAGGAGIKSVASGDTITFNNYNTGIVTIAAPILANGTNAVVFNGTGTTALTGANTYTGVTTVSGGTLLMSGSTLLTGGVTVSGGAFSWDTSAFVDANHLNIGTINVAAGGTLNLTNTRSVAFGTNDTLFNNQVLQGAGTVNQTGGGVVDWWSGTDISGFSGAYNVLNGILSIQGTTAAAMTTTATVNLTASTGFLDLRTQSFGADRLTGGGTVGSSFTGSYTLTVGTNNGSSQFDGVIKSGGISGGSATIALTKTGTGTFTLTGANTYTGATTISGGTLQVGNGGSTGSLGSGAVVDNAALSFDRSDSVTVANAISGTGTVAQAGTGTLKLTGANTYSGATSIAAGTLEIGGTGTLGASGIYAGAIVNSGTLLVSTSSNQTLSGIISGAGALGMAGTGTLTLSGANTYTGATTVNAGTLNVTGSLTSSIAVNAGGALSGSGVTTGNLVLASGSTLIGATGTEAGVNGTAFTAGNIDTSAGNITLIGTLSGSGTLDIARFTGSWNGSTANFNLSGYRAGSTVSQIAAATGQKLQLQITNLTDTWNAASGTWDNSQGAGVWTNGSDNKYYSADTVIFGDLAGATAAVTVGAVVTPNSVTFNNATTNYTLSGTGGIGGTASLTKQGAGTVTLNAANTFSGATTLAGGLLALGNAGALGSTSSLQFTGGTLQYSASNTVDYSAKIAGSTGAISIDTNGQNVTYATALTSGNTGGLTKLGAGTLTLSVASGYTGATTVIDGTLNVTGGISASSPVILGGAAGTSGALVLSGGSMNLSGLTTAAGGGANSTLTYNNSGAINSGVSITGATTLNSALAVGLTGIQGQVTFAGITGGGVAAGGTALSFSNASGAHFYINGGAGTYDYTGNVQFLAGSGSYTFQAGSIFTADTSVIVNSGALIQTNANGVTFAFDALNGSGQWDTYNGATSTLSIGNGGGSGAFGGTITNSNGTNNVIKAGTGTQILSGANTYTGTTKVNGGTLLINGSLASGSAVTVATGAILGGVGTVNGAITVNGTLQGGAGAATGTLTTVGAVTLASDSIVQLALGASGVNSSIAVGAGGMTFDINQKFTFLDTGGVVEGNVYTLITGLASDPTAGNHWSITNSGWSGDFSYSNNDLILTLTAVPEPGTYGLIGAGALAAVALVRRRRKAAGAVA